MLKARWAAGLTTISNAWRVNASKPSIKPVWSASRRSVSMVCRSRRRLSSRFMLMPLGKVRLRTEKFAPFGSSPTENGLYATPR